MLEDPGEPFSILLSYIFNAIFKPFDFSVFIEMGVLLILIACSALISGSEIAFFSLSKLEINNMKNSDSAKKRKIYNLLQNPKKLLASILITNNFVNIAIVILSAYTINQIFYFENYEILAFMIEVIVITSIILLLGEIMPKVYASQQATFFAKIMSPSLVFISALLSPLTYVLVNSTAFIDRRIERKGHEISKDDLSEAIDIAVDDSSKNEEKQMLKGIVKFSDIEVKEIMKSRVDVTAVDFNLTFDEILSIIRKSGYSRIPVYKNSFDNIVGVLYIKNLLPYLSDRKNVEWNKLIKKAFFVPENKKINDLLREMKEKKKHLAIVVDEYGGTSGIVTLEDIIEEIVGEINDEFDSNDDEFNYKKQDNQHYIFEGKTSINDFCKVLNIEDDIFDDIKGESDSLAGLLLEITGDFPSLNEEITFYKFTFKVLEMDERRIQKIEVTINESL